MADGIESGRAQLDAYFNGVWRERASMEPLWREVGSYVLPTRPRFFESDANRGERGRNARIFDGTATQALSIAKSGLLAAMASPARPWFTLELEGKRGALGRPERRWLDGFRDALLGVFERSNFYTALGDLFEDEMVFGTAGMMVFDDADLLMRFEVLPIGSFGIAQNSKGKVDVLCREFTMTARQVLDEFGAGAASDTVRDSIAQKQRERQIAVRHMIVPNQGKVPGGAFRDAATLPFVEFYWEKVGGQGGGYDADKPNWSGSAEPTDFGKLLRVSGYQEFPGIISRWGRNADDVYGMRCPAIDAMPDIRQLQTMTRKGLNALEKMVDPPVLAGAGLKGKHVSLLSGAVTIDPDMTGGSSGARSLHEVTARLDHLEAALERCRARIRRFFMEDIFLMLLGDARAQPPTAEEVRARERERNTVLGPISERKADEVFGPVVERGAAMLIRRSLPDWMRGEDGILPRPPESLVSQELRVGYISEIAQGQKMAGLVSVERHLAFVGNMAQLYPPALDVPDLDAAIVHHAEIMGVPAKLTRDAQAIAAIRQMRSEQVRAQQMREQAPGLAKAAKDLSETDADAAVEAGGKVLQAVR